jgi:hypothetical protein
MWRCGMDSAGIWWGPLMGSSENADELSDYIKGGEFFD